MGDVGTAGLAEFALSEFARLLGTSPGQSSRPVPSQDEVERMAFRVVASLLQRHKDVDSRAWLSASSRPPIRRFSIFPHAAEIEHDWREGNGLHIQHYPIGKGDTVFGELEVAIRGEADELRIQAIEGDASLCARALECGIRFSRAMHDRSAVEEVSRGVSDAKNPRDAMVAVCETIRTLTSSDGVKVYLIKHGGRSQGMEQLYRTDRPESLRVPANDGADRREQPISEDTGLAAWVVRNDDWLLIKKCQPPERTGLDPEQGTTGTQGSIEVLAHPEANYVGHESVLDDEKTLLFVPFHLRGQVVGVVAVWRHEDAPYNADLDVRSLQQIAPYVTSACRHVLRLERTEAEFKHIAAISAALRPGPRAPNPYPQMLGTVVRQSSAAAGIVLDREGNRFFFLEGYTLRGGDSNWEKSLRGWSVTVNPDSPLDALHRALKERLSATGFHTVEVEVLPIALHSSNPIAAIALLRDVARKALGGLGSLYDDISSSHSFVRYFGILLEHFGGFRATQLVGDVGGPTIGDHGNARSILVGAATLVKENTAGEVVFVLETMGEALRSTDATPRCDAAIGVVVGPKTRTMEAVRKGTTDRVLDVQGEVESSATKFDAALLDEVAKKLEWRAIRSWMCCPVRFQGRNLGAIAVLTSTDGPFLTARDQQIAETVTVRAAWEIQKLARGNLLEDLNALADRAATLTGAALGDSLIRDIPEWIERHLRPGCEVAILSRKSTGETLIQRGTSSIDEPMLKWLEGESRRNPGSKSKFAVPGHLSRSRHGIGVPVRLSSAEDLSGHLMVLSKKEFLESDFDTVREAGRELAVLLHGERLYHDWGLANGLFRHALLGPVQGLSSAALAIAYDVGEVGGELEKLARKIDEECEVIRHWQRTSEYALGRVVISPRNQPLIQVVERCAERYRDAMKYRGIDLQLRWNPKGQLDFFFDSNAIDLALSNILDNARKYSFFNRSVTLGVDHFKNVVAIWVEDVGHAIPESVGERIYETGTRADLADPLRIIRGEGLGLALARKMIEAHDGTLSHTCTIDGHGATPTTTPYKVRFTMHLPMNRGRRSS